MMDHGKNNWIGVLIIVAIVIGAFFFVSQKREVVTPDQATPSTTALTTLPLFEKGLDAVAINADQIGYHDFSPNGKYFFFSAFKTNGAPANTAYLMDTKDGSIVSLPGMPQRGLEDNRAVQLWTEQGPELYFLESGETKQFSFPDNYGFGSLAPDGKTFVLNTQDGIRAVDVGSGAITSISDAQYDGAYAWYQDSKRILGFKETGEDLFEAGKGRVLGIWNIETKEFTPIETSIADKNIRSVRWVVPGVVANVNTGWDDGSHDYLVNVDMKRVINVGDTSGSLMGGVSVDADRGLFAVVGGDDQSTIGSKVLLYRGIELEHELTLPKGYFRQSVQIVDVDRLLYLRNQQGSKGITAQALVLLDLDSGNETVLRELPAKAFVSLSLAPDHKTWVLSLDKAFYTGTL
jgi:hypothetical protein